MTVQKYVEELNRRYKSGYSREHSYRRNLQSLLESILPNILVTKQYFRNVPKKAWEFYIGGYQTAEKWLKDRRDRELTVSTIKNNCGSYGGG